MAYNAKIFLVAGDRFGAVGWSLFANAILILPSSDENGDHKAAILYVWVILS